MKTIEECKEEIAISYDFSNWQELKDTCKEGNHFSVFETILKEATILFSNQFTEKEVFEQLLDAELKKLPYTKHLDDGQYNDGVLTGFELGARWSTNH